MSSCLRSITPQDHIQSPTRVVTTQPHLFPHYSTRPPSYIHYTLLSTLPLPPPTHPAPLLGGGGRYCHHRRGVVGVGCAGHVERHSFGAHCRCWVTRGLRRRRWLLSVCRRYAVVIAGVSAEVWMGCSIGLVSCYKNSGGFVERSGQRYSSVKSSFIKCGRGLSIKLNSGAYGP